MSNNYTPGPWRVTREVNVDERDRNEINKTLYAIASGRQEGPFPNKGHFHPSDAEFYTHENYVVKLSTDRDYGYYEGGIENKADANLIAAAPDLYEALKELLNYGVEFEHADYVVAQIDKEAIKDARAAIAKAKGELS